MDFKAQLEEAEAFLSLRGDDDEEEDDKSDASSVDIYSDLESDQGTEFIHNGNNSFDNSFKSVAKFISSLQKDIPDNFDEEIYNELEKVDIEKKDATYKDYTLPSHSKSDMKDNVHIINECSNDLDLFSEFLAAEASEKEEKAQKAKEEYDQLKRDNCELKKQKRAMAAQLAGLRHENLLLKKNISALFRTAKEEVQRKDEVISELREQLDGFNFRRSRLLAVNNVPTSNVPSCQPEKSEKTITREIENYEKNPMKLTTGYLSSNHSEHAKEESTDGLAEKIAKSKKHKLHLHKKHEKKLSRSKKEHKLKRDYPSDLEDTSKSEERLQKKRQKLSRVIDKLEEKSFRTYLKKLNKTDDSDNDDLPSTSFIKEITKAKDKKQNKLKNADLITLKLKKLKKRMKRLSDEVLESKGKEKLKVKHKFSPEMDDASTPSCSPASPQESNKMTLTDFVNFKLFNFIVNSPTESLQRLGTNLAKKKESKLENNMDSEYLVKRKLPTHKSLNKEIDSKSEPCSLQIAIPSSRAAKSSKQQGKLPNISTVNSKNKGNADEINCDLLRLQGYRNKVKIATLNNTLAKLKEMKQPSNTQNKNEAAPKTDFLAKQNKNPVLNWEKTLAEDLSKVQANKSESDMDISDGNSGSNIHISCGSDMDLVTSDEEGNGHQNIASYENYFDIPNSPVLVIEEDKTLESGTENADDSGMPSTNQSHKIASEVKFLFNKNDINIQTSKTLKAGKCAKQLPHDTLVITVNNKIKEEKKDDDEILANDTKQIHSNKLKLLSHKLVKQVNIREEKQIPVKENKIINTNEFKQPVIMSEPDSIKNLTINSVVNKTIILNSFLHEKLNQISSNEINCKTNSETSNEENTVSEVQLKEGLEEGEIDSDLTDEDCDIVEGKRVIKTRDSVSETKESSHNSHSLCDNDLNKDKENITKEECSSNENHCKEKKPVLAVTASDMNLKVSKHHLPPLCSRQTMYRIGH